MAEEVQENGSIINVEAAIGRSITAATQSRSCSAQYMQGITKATLEHILFCRINFDRKEFKQLIVDNNIYSVLRKTLNNPKLVIFKAMMDTLMNLIEKDYVQEVDMLFASVNDPDHPVELYTVKFSFSPHDCQDVAYCIQRKMTNDLRESTSEIFANVSNLDNNYAVLHHEDIGIRFTILLRNQKDPVIINRLIKLEQDHAHEGEIALKNGQDKYVSILKLGKMQTGYHIILAKAKGDVYERE